MVLPKAALPGGTEAGRGSLNQRIATFAILEVGGIWHKYCDPSPKCKLVDGAGKTIKGEVMASNETTWHLKNGIRGGPNTNSSDG